MSDAARALAEIRDGPEHGFSPAQIDVIKRTIARGASDEELRLFLSTASRLGLDPFAQQIHAVFRFDREENRKVMTIQFDVSALRLFAERTGLYAGQRGPEWCGPDGAWRDVWLESKPPAGARVAVFRRDWPRPLWGTARFESYVQTTREGQPKGLWRTMPDMMLAKAAERNALMRAFPLECVPAMARQRETVEVVNMQGDVVAELPAGPGVAPDDLEALDEFERDPDDPAEAAADSVGDGPADSGDPPPGDISGPGAEPAVVGDPAGSGSAGSPVIPSEPPAGPEQPPLEPNERKILEEIEAELDAEGPELEQTATAHRWEQARELLGGFPGVVRAYAKRWPERPLKPNEITLEELDQLIARVLRERGA